jgi:hypothetical protein
LAGVDVILGVICITNPKACFGSCPTFYLNENTNIRYADAEGFSDAISPSLENFDIDAINNKYLADSTFSITMKNEALETHCVNDIKLLTYPLLPNERVYQTRSNDFCLCENKYELTKATAEEGDITSLVKNDDRQERFSLSDEKNLSCKEEIFLNFENLENTADLGLIINFRQTLLTTYLMYSAYGYSGDEIGDVFARIEHGTSTGIKFGANLYKELGNIDVYSWNEKANTWDFQGGWYETGPIAINRQLLPLKNSPASKSVKIKLVLNKGMWRLDYFALTNLKEKVTPSEISPCQITTVGKNDPLALAEIKDPTKYLISMPGSIYTIKFSIPQPGKDYELFLYTKGYYLEWMRSHWLKDKNLPALRQMFANPKKYLRKEASSYKKYEAQMEQEFWSSKISFQNMSTYEK